MHLPWRNVAPGVGPAVSTSLLADETDELRKLAAGVDVLEIGSAYGYSTVAMALSARSVTTVDPHTAHDSYRALMANLGVYGVAGKVDVRRGLSQVELPYLVAGQRRFGLVFVDGDHTERGVAADVAWAVRLLGEGGVLACHDYGEDCCCPGVRAALDQMFPDGPDDLVGTLAVYRP